MPKGYALGFLTGLNQSFEKQQEQRNKLQQIGYEQQAKQSTPEEQARMQVLQLIGALRPPTAPLPEGGFSRSELEQPQLADVYRPVQAMAGLQADIQNQPILQRLGMLERSGLLPRAPLSLEDIFTQSKARSEGTGTQAEKSYELHSKSIDQYQKPVDERLDRLSRLQDTMSQQTPQADALLAPELLTVMAGGQGSGLRMNEAEIARIVGGRTNWESLKAKLNKWNFDPTKGLSVTPAQRQQMRDLVRTVQDKLNQKGEILNTARQQLINATQPQEHRQIIFQMRQALQNIDAGTLSNEDPVIRTGRDTATGRRVGMTRSGKTVPLD